ncbi:MAG: protein-disulfide reductase DsbD family protein [Crocinitomicaceae bacterium]|nr:protein-disulfide reductase DsbD family protein [Crocinitomicaceae bacterium]
MIKNILIIVILAVGFQSFGQEKVRWAVSYDEASSNIEIEATIADGWHLYSQHINNEIGPIPTSFSYGENEHYTLVGETVEPESIKEYDPNFEGDLNFFKNKVMFTQGVLVSEETEVNGVITFMICNDTMCMPPEDQNFTITIN